MQNHYQILAVDSAASPAEIKRAFRQEIARYHPDKVQHLGQEFQSMAATRAAQLTEAYRILMDAGLRAEYDQLLGVVTASEQAPPAAPPHSPPARGAEPENPPASPFPVDRPPQSSSERATRDEFVQKAIIGRLRQALADELGALNEPAARGFEFSCVAKSKKLFGRGGAGPRFVARFVPRVDRAAVQQTWAMAAKAETDGDICVFLMGSAIAPVRELSDAIAEQRRRAAGGGERVVMIPLDVRDWHALVPNDAPPSCKAILKRLRETSAT